MELNDSRLDPNLTFVSQIISLRVTVNLPVSGTVTYSSDRH